MKTTFIEFWLRGINPGEFIDHRATAEAELVAFLDRLDLGEDRPLVYLNGDSDWLAAGIPPEWIADMLETIGRYPAADYHLYTIAPEFCQQRLAAVARLASPGGLIARQWLDGIHPPGLRVGGPPAAAAILSAIPMARPRRIEPGVIDSPLPTAPPVELSPPSTRHDLAHLARQSS